LAHRDAKSQARKEVKQGSPKRGAQNINCMCESCGKLKARNFFLRQGRVFSRRVRGGERFRKNPRAMILRKILRKFAIAR
jgi:hypothetical protein